MPNWCHNTLRISGEEEDVFRWVQRARTPAEPAQDDGSPLYFSSMLPEPDDVGKGWWDWRIENWGTKWEPSFLDSGVPGDSPESGHPNLRRGKGFAEYTFDTAWGPPLEWAFAVSKKCPELRLEVLYGEPGMDFGGKMIFAAGEIVERNEGTAEEFLPEHLLWF